jgi:plastocyanin
MRYRTWIAGVVLSTLLGCDSMTSPSGGGGGGTAGHVTVGNTYYRSDHNGSQNPAVDTVPVGSTVVWSWNATGPHMIQSTGLPGIFRNSVVMDAANASYSVTFKNPGTYTYQCGVHGSAMTGLIVVE